jgi:pyruvate/2-oxoglutarate dehydrogenase complex dihydrolipoamide dehydrogenase (E3) component
LTVGYAPSQRHVYACGDALVSFQFTHYAGWHAGERAEEYAAD